MTVQALHFYRDEDASAPITGSVNMDAVKAGETVEKTFYVKNEVDYVVEVDGFVLKAVSGYAELISSPERVQSGDTKPVKVRLSPDTTTLESLKFELEASYEFKTD